MHRVVLDVEIFTRGAILQYLRHRLCQMHGRGTPVMVAFLFQAQVNTCMFMCMLCLCLYVLRLLHRECANIFLELVARASYSALLLH
jgi:hypothetical protein